MDVIYAKMKGGLAARLSTTFRRIMLTFFCDRLVRLIGWVMSQPGGHSIVNGSFTINMNSFIFIKQ